MISIYILYKWDGSIVFGTVATSREQANLVFNGVLKESEELFTKKYFIKEIEFLIPDGFFPVD